MPRIVKATTILALLVGLGLPAAAEAQQKVNLSVGYFALKGEDGRIEEDVLVENLDFLSFEIDDFNSFTFGGEYLAGLGEYLEAGVGIGYYGRTVPTVYRDLVHDDGAEIETDLKLRVVPITATIRVLPLGQSNPFQPYIGGGIAALNWRYSETGEFVDLRDNSIFRDNFVETGTDFAPVFVGGVRFPIGDQISLGGELQYHTGRGKLGTEELFLTDDIDLGGYTASGTITFSFR